MGWKLDADFMIGKDVRAVQLTPQGSPCSIHLEPTGVPGTARGMFLVVSDIAAARRALTARGEHHWSDWYAAYMVSRERGSTPDQAVKDATLHTEGLKGVQR